MMARSQIVDSARTSFSERKRAMENLLFEARTINARSRWQLDSAHQRRSYRENGVQIACGGREFFPLPIESRTPIYARPAYHPDLADRAWDDFLDRVVDVFQSIDSWVWSDGGKRASKRLFLGAGSALALLIFLHTLHG